MLQNSYWNNKGKYKCAADELQKLIPDSGPVSNPKTNKALEKFRVASNVYYDVFNNGLCGRTLQRGGDFRRSLGFAYTKYIFLKGYITARGRYNIPSYDFRDDFFPMLEAAMDGVIEAAAKEQGIPLE